MINRLLDELRSPFNLITGTIGVLGLVFAIYTWYATQQRAEIAFRVEQVQMLDVGRLAPVTLPTGDPSDNFSVQPFKVLDGNGNAITQNIYGANITIWNSGDINLDRDRVRKPLTISLGGNARVIDASLTYTTDSNVSEFAMSPRSEADRAATISWKYFDPKSGFRVRLIYVAENQLDVNLAGTIYGVSGFLNASEMRNFNVIFAMSGVVFGLAVNKVGRIYRNKSNGSSKDRLLIIFSEIVFMAFAILLIGVIGRYGVFALDIPF